MDFYEQLIFETLWFLPLIFFMVGACVGSFLNVCILRLPKEKSIINPPSTCACGKAIRWFDNIPIFSWFILGGKARCCGEKFSIRYPFIELLTACLFCYMAIYFPLPKLLIGTVFISLMIMSTFIDIDNLFLPDSITVGGAVLGVLLSTLVPSFHDCLLPKYPFFVSMLKSLSVSILGLAVGSGILYWMRLLAQTLLKREAMGEGDVVLLGCIGAFCGWQGAIFSIFGGSVIGSLLMLPILLLSKIFNKEKPVDKKAEPQESEEETGTIIPFGPWLCLGAALYFLFFSEFIDAYFDTFVTGLFQ